MGSRAFERKTAGRHVGPSVASGPARQGPAHVLLRLQRTAGNQAVVRALARSRKRSAAAVLPGPLLQRDDWDFTPADYTALVKQKKNLRFEADSAWFPKPLQENLCKTLIFALTATNPARTGGINRDDFYHGHLLVPRGKKTEELSKKITEFEAKADKLQGKALGGKSFDPVTTENIGAYTKAMQETEKLATPILEEVVKIEGAAVIYHTYEYSGPKMKPGSPIRKPDAHRRNSGRLRPLGHREERKSIFGRVRLHLAVRLLGRRKRGRTRHRRNNAQSLTRHRDASQVMTDAGDEYGLLAVKVALAEGRHSEALELLDDIPAQSSEEEAHKLVLSGQAFEGLNEPARARDAYQRAQSLAPGLPTSILREGVLRYHRGDRAGARLLLYRYVDVEPGNPEAFYYLARCEDAPERQADVVRKLALLDGPTAPWSRELLGSQTG